ncbi:MAG: hypothetical protein U0414_43490 [Polyangiaceae bacterium]
MNAANARKLIALAAVTVVAGTMLTRTAEAGIVFTTSCSELPLMSTSTARKTDQPCAEICLNKTCGKVNVDCFNECVGMDDQPEGICDKDHPAAACDGAAPFVCGGYNRWCAATQQDCAIFLRQLEAKPRTLDVSFPRCSEAEKWF